MGIFLGEGSKFPSMSQIDALREGGIRPQVSIALVNEQGRLLICSYKDKARNNLWFLPQGGIENGDDAPQTIMKEIREELGKGFVEKVSTDTGRYELLMTTTYPLGKGRKRPLQTDSGTEIDMIGKRLYVYIVPCKGNETPDTSESEYSEFMWASSADLEGVISDERYHSQERDDLRPMHALVARLKQLETMAKARSSERKNNADTKAT
jgi:8-oxo-dGTP pyrophosphatase MutT (NUDIX family)